MTALNTYSTYRHQFLEKKKKKEDRKKDWISWACVTWVVKKIKVEHTKHHFMNSIRNRCLLKKKKVKIPMLLVYVLKSVLHYSSRVLAIAIHVYLGILSEERLRLRSPSTFSIFLHSFDLKNFMRQQAIKCRYVAYSVKVCCRVQ